jgi:hypothetical protein
MEKHTPYFNVLEAVQKKGDCALCFLEKKAVHSYFDSLLYENVNNSVVRNVLRQSRGYCPYHAHHLAAFHDALALSILYKEQVLLAASFLEKAASHKNISQEWTKHDSCPACRQTAQIRHHYADILAEGMAEPEMREAFLTNFTICLNHLLMVMDRLHDDNLKKELTRKMCERLVNLAGRLEQYCQDSQKNAVGEVVDSPHRFAWREAVAIAVGLKDTFEPLL